MIKQNVERILGQLPPGVQVVAAAKARSAEEIKEAVEAGIKIVGENYVQEAEDKIKAVGRVVEWHFIGHLQSNKVKRAVEIFDLIETVDSLKIAQEINKVCRLKNKTMPVLLEINCARENQKFGILPENLESLFREICQLKYIKLLGLMTMGPFLENPQDLRPLFRETREAFERIKSLSLPGARTEYLSMGMSDSYQIAIDEGANLVRIGTAIFGKRKTRG